MKHNIIEKLIPKKYVVNEFGEFEVWDLYDTLTEGLGDSEMGTPVVLHDSGMKKWFDSLGIIHINVRGSCYLKDEEKFKELVESIKSIVYAE